MCNVAPLSAVYYSVNADFVQQCILKLSQVPLGRGSGQENDLKGLLTSFFLLAQAAGCKPVETG